MRKVGPYLVWLVCICLCSSCYKKWDDRIIDNFSSDKSYYRGSQIRFNGYYYNVDSDASGTQRINAMFFYRNGVALKANPYELKDTLAMLNEFKDGTFIKKAKGGASYWGQFYISEGSLIYEVPSTLGFSGRQLLSHFGRIENDTTLVFFISQRVNGANQVYINEKYTFRQLSPKPDSVNKYVY